MPPGTVAARTLCATSPMAVIVRGRCRSALHSLARRHERRQPTFPRQPLSSNASSLGLLPPPNWACQEGARSAQMVCPDCIHILREIAMTSMVVIKCPVTDDEVPTGLAMNLHSLHLLPTETVELQCPACGQRHVWSRRDAYLSLRSTVAAGRARRSRPTVRPRSR